VINNFKLERYYQQQEPRWSAYLLLNAFINDIPWKEQVNKINYQASLTKQDIMDFCNQYLNNNYVVVYKKQGKPDDNKIEKPEITPIPTNRDEESDFLAGIKARTIKPIEPVFVDYKKDMSILKVKDNTELLYTQNKTNPLFSLHYVFDMGNNHDKTLGTAFSYLNYLGTSTKSAEQINSELYQLACSFGVSATDDRVYVSVSGLSDNFEQAVNLLEERLADAQVDIEAYNNLTMDILKQRTDDKLDQYSNFNKLRTYAIWGSKSPATNILSEAELKSMNPQELVDRIKSLSGYQHRILYYGPMAEKEVVDFLTKNHQTADQLKPIPEPTEFTLAETNENKVLLAHYDANQVYMALINKGVGFNKEIEADREMYNSYFGGGMNSIVFQEMREARGLAYSAWASYSKPSKPSRPYHLTAFIATQNDKVKEAVETFESILNNMPESEKAFNLAKESILTNIRTTRTLRESILWSYIHAQEFDYTTDPNKELFEKIPSLTLPDVKAFQEKYIKNKPKIYTILGDTKDLDMNYLKQIGNVRILSQEEIFGY